MPGQDVRLDLVARRKPMQRRGGEYFTKYQMHGLHITPANVYGRPALWANTEVNEGAGSWCWSGGTGR
jgi:hypothetical protein